MDGDGGKCVMRAAAWRVSFNHDSFTHPQLRRVAHVEALDGALDEIWRFVESPSNRDGEVDLGPVLVRLKCVGIAAV